MSLSKGTNPDLEEARRICSINVPEFTTWWYGGEEKLALKRKIEKHFTDDLSLHHPVPLYYHSHKERYEETMRTTALVVEKIKKLKSEGETQIDFDTIFKNMATVFAPFGNPLAMHFLMFVNMIISLGTDEQQLFWIPRAKSLEIIGCYAQTELGHGTFLRGMETTATYDPETKEFILNSPTKSAFKFWPGALGQTANHCVLMAQLITQGKPRGVVPFIVPVRDLLTHMPLPGVTIGEIGPKFIDSMNNGFLGLDNVRIPLDYMLMRTAKVLPDGTFAKNAPSILTYQTMTLQRVNLVEEMSEYLAKASTIAVRYSLVRRQSQINAHEKEVQVIDHLTQQMKVFPHLAKAIVFKLASDSLHEIHENVTSDLMNGQFSRLSEMHALTCCLKAVSTSDASAGVEGCRLACGGHGYLGSSGFPGLSGYVFTARAFDGENTVMLLQTTRFLMKSWNNAREGQTLQPTISYLSKVMSSFEVPAFKCDPIGIIAAFERASALVLSYACEEIEMRKTRGMTQAEAVNSKSMELVRAAELHCRTFLLTAANEALKKLTKEVSPSLANVIGDLIELFFTETALSHMDILIRFSRITPEDISLLQQRLERVLTRLRPNVLGIVDGFEFSDNLLNSSLGAKDGNVYERLFAEAMKSPLNQEPVNKSFELYLKPFMQLSKM